MSNESDAKKEMVKLELPREDFEAVLRFVLEWAIKKLPREDFEAILRFVLEWAIKSRRQSVLLKKERERE